uniref:Uncharacterized protein n=1 Tax=Avena sativa TaxID=4498 RepID=A0ACD5U937_AVESA
MSPYFACLLVALSLALLVSLSSPAAAMSIPSHNHGAAVEAPVEPTWAQFLQVQNEARDAVGVAPLRWNWTIELDAMNYANELRVPCTLLPMAWPTDGVYGRNLYYGSGHHSAAHAAAAWVDERRWYDHGANACAEGKTCGDYTQVVWNTTTHLGCARRTCKNGLDTAPSATTSLPATMSACCPTDQFIYILYAS